MLIKLFRSGESTLISYCVEMALAEMFAQGQILTAHELLQDSIKVGTDFSIDDARLHHMIKEEYKQLRHSQSQMQDVSSWKRQYIDKRACDSDDIVEILKSLKPASRRDFLVQVAIEDGIPRKWQRKQIFVEGEIRGQARV